MRLLKKVLGMLRAAPQQEVAEMGNARNALDNSSDTEDPSRTGSKSDEATIPSSLEGKQEGEDPLPTGNTQYERFQRRMARKEEAAEIRRATKQRRKDELAEKKRWNGKRRRILLTRQQRVLKEHIEALKLKRLQCLNTWGRLEREQWAEVKSQFITSVLRAAKADVPSWMAEIDEQLGRVPKKLVKTPTVLHGTRFEVEVAIELRKLGWTVQLLGKAGDQGGDLMGQKGTKTLLVQCKNYGSKAGNGAVQEAIAGKQFYNATTAAVVAPVGFTRQAHALADKTGILLLAPDQLSLLG